MKYAYHVLRGYGASVRVAKWRAQALMFPRELVSWQAAYAPRIAACLNLHVARWGGLSELLGAHS